MRQKIASTSLWFTILSLTASALNFAYYPAISRFLNLAQFGDVQIGLSFVMQAAALFSSLNLVALYVGTSKQSSENITARLERAIILPSIIGSFLVALFAVPISHLLQLHDPTLLYLLAIIFILNIPAGTWLGTLQGEGSFIQSGWISLAASFIKIISSIVLILCGFEAHGAVIGIIIGTFTIIPLCYFAQNSRTLDIRHTFSLPRKEDLRFLFSHKTIVAILTTFVLFSLISTFDTLFAKIILNPTEAGMFSQLSTIAKVPYYLLLPISMILFGRFIVRPWHQIKTAAFYFAGASVTSLVIYIIAEPLCTALFKLTMNRDAHDIIGVLLIAFCAFIVNNLLVYLLVSRGAIMKPLSIATVNFIGTLVALSYSSSALDIALRFALSQVLTTILLSFVVVYTRGNVSQLSHPVGSDPRI